MNRFNKSQDENLEVLLEYIKESRGIDFTAYKRSSLQRRIFKQMESRGIDSYSDYLDYLQVHPEEFGDLFNTILINVTSFFRDKDAWNFLQSEVIPSILGRKSPRDPIRIWSVGCSSGQEAYTIAIILAEVLGMDNFCNRVKIYGTDIDEDALNEARRARYPRQSIEIFPKEIRERYFEPLGNNEVAFSPELRRFVIFGRHNLIYDAPICRLDLLICRNTLMYFNAETQREIVRRFHFALHKSGFLFLGKAEMLLNQTNLFTPISLPHHIFKKINNSNRQDSFLTLAQNNYENNDNYLDYKNIILEYAFNEISLAQIVVDINGNLALINQAAQSIFKLSSQDIGRPLKDLEISYRPLELRSIIERVAQERQSIKINNTSYTKNNDNIIYFDIEIKPLEKLDKTLLGFSIIFNDLTIFYELEKELQRAYLELEKAKEEMQSSNEELETTNEELQSTNEELETTNEELQSTNDELQVLNDELRQRTDELNQTNAFLNSLIASFKAGVIVIDRQFIIITWNEKAEELWGLRSNEVKGVCLFGLEIGLPVEELREPIIKCLNEGNDSQTININAINRRGQKITVNVSFNLLIDLDGESVGVIILIKAKT